MQQKVENDKRWQDKIKHSLTDIKKITSARFFTGCPTPVSSSPIEQLWFAMNQKFHKKQLWWEWRWQKLRNHILRLENTLAERNDTIKQLEAMLGIQNENEKRKGSDQREV